jgi:hypothetical protein
LTVAPSHSRSARCRCYRLCALSDCQSQDGQVAFSNLVFRTNRTSSKQKEIFFQSSTGWEQRELSSIHRCFLTLVNLFTNLPPEPADPPNEPTMFFADAEAALFGLSSGNCGKRAGCRSRRRSNAT